MKLLIEINDKMLISDIKKHGLTAESKTDKEVINILYNGTPLTDLTNGEVMKRMFPYAKVTHTEDWTPDNSKDLFKREFVMVDFGEGSVGFNSLWWNSKWGEA